MKNRDALTRFVFDRFAVRGQIVHLDAVWRTVLARREYPPAIRSVLGEAMAAAALLSSTIKYQGELSLQLQGRGALRLLLVQCTSEGTLRGLARWKGQAEDHSLHDLCGGGVLAINIDPGHGEERYQGIVELTGGTMGAALEHYFSQSEQLSTRLLLTSSQDTAAGLLLQRLPGELGDPDAWNRIQTLGATLSGAELRNLEAPDIVHRLFHEEDVRLFDSESLSFRCTCSRERTAGMLRSLGYEEIRSILDEQEDRVRVNCEFCGMRYVFDPVDVEALFSLAVPPDVSRTRH
jgi:molecular chaperone Hsp33